MKRPNPFLWLAVFVILVGIGLVIAQFYMFTMSSKTNAHASSETAKVLAQGNEGDEKFPPEKSQPGKKKPKPALDELAGAKEKAGSLSMKDELHGYWVKKAMDHAEEEQYVEALNALDKAIEIKPAGEDARTLASEINCMLGRKSYREKDLPRAEELFNEVLYYTPEGACGLLGLGLVAYRMDVDLEKSKKLLDSYIRGGGDESIAFQALGEIHYHENDLDRAALFLEKALSRDPENRGISGMLRRVQRERKVEKKFSTDDSRHFMVKYEGMQNAQAGYLILIQLEEARLVVGQILDYYPSIPITAILYTNEQFQDVTHSPAWAKAIFDGKIRIPAKGLKEESEVLKRIVFHEYTHALIFEYTRGNPVPVWLHEGLAQNSEGRVSEYNERIFQVFAKTDRIIPLRYLENSFLGFSTMEAQMAYAESLAAIRYIKTRHGEYALRALLDELRDGATMEQAINSVFYTSYNEFDKRFLNWLNIYYE